MNYSKVNGNFGKVITRCGEVSEASEKFVSKLLDFWQTLGAKYNSMFRAYSQSAVFRYSSILTGGFASLPYQGQ